MNKQFKIVHKNTLNFSEIEIIKNYWTFNEALEDFFYLPKQLTNEIFKKSIDVTKFVKKNSYIICDHLKCIDCKENFSFETRKTYMDFYHSHTELCPKCFNNLIDSKTDEMISSLRNIIFNKAEISEKEIFDLSYMEKIILYYIIMMVKDEINYELVNIFDLFKSLNNGVLNEIYSIYIKRLIDKRVLRYIDSEEVLSCWKSLNQYWSEIQNRSELEKIREIARLGNYRYQSFLSFNRLENLINFPAEYSELLLKSISSHILSEKDFNDIENIVVKHKMIQANILVSNIKKGLKIPIDMSSIKLEFILSDMVRNTTLYKMYSMLFSAAENLNKKLYIDTKNGIYHTKKEINNLYMKNLEWYFNKYRDKFEEVYDRKIPLDFILDDGFIDFLSLYSIGGDWNGTSANDLISQWINNIENQTS